jgi:hypothetical protein
MDDYKFDEFLIDQSINKSGVKERIITEIDDGEGEGTYFQIELKYNNGASRMMLCSGDALVALGLAERVDK